MELNKTMTQRILILFCLILILTACTNKQEKEEGTEAAVLETISLETKYITLQYPKEFESVLKHREVVQDSIAMEIFYMTGGWGDWELFRLYFNDSSMGATVGYLTRGMEQIPVSYSVCEYEDIDFPNEQAKNAYDSIMDCFDVVLDSVCENPQFQDERWMEPVENQIATMTYWNVVIPKNVLWEEQETNGNYRVLFYGIIQDERVDLYAVGLGEMDADYSVGYFATGGVTRPIQVKIFDLPQVDSWMEQDYDVAYRMLESINAVIDTVMAHAQFLELEPIVPLE